MVDHTYPLSREFICRMDDEGYDITSFTVPFTYSRSHYFAAMDFAEHCYHSRDGWEYMPKNCLIVWITDCETGEERKFSIETEFEPSFNISEFEP